MDYTSDKISEMLLINVRQKEYYEFHPETSFSHGTNIVSKLWNKLRQIQYNILKDLDYKDRIYDLHCEWMGDLKDKKVLDLGCHIGNFLSKYMASNSREYYAVDLSESALSCHKSEMEQFGINTGKYISTDILSDSFVEFDFDVIYARYVFSHFKYMDVFLDKIKKHLKNDGIIITYDPLNTYFPLRLFRFLYRFFQTDRDWEYPFTIKTLNKIQNHFQIIKSAGSMGRTKYIFLICFISKNLASKMIEKWQNHDLFKTPINSRSFSKLIGVSFLLKNILQNNDS